MDIRELDANFQFGEITTEGLHWYGREQACFEWEGCADREHLHRIGAADLQRLPERVQYTAPSAGIRLRFRSDTACVALKALIMFLPDMSRMARSGSHGFDLYVGEEGETPAFRQIFMPENGRKEVSGEYRLPADGKIRDFELNLPLYNGVEEFWLGLSEGAVILPPQPRKLDKPVVFYGSSITQGGCASRPGSAYTNLIAQQLQVPVVNLGFSGNAKGEPEMAEYIASLPMAAFVMDYDHNAETPEELARTHEPFFRIIREKQPQLPVLLMSRPNSDGDPGDAAERFRIIRRTWQTARAAGDDRVWLLDGRTLFGARLRDNCTVDGCHPNDLGFYRMYQSVRKKLVEMLPELS